jgi:hypothetical protein
LNQDPHQQKRYLKLRIGQHIVNLIFQVISKYAEETKRTSNFQELLSKELCCAKGPKKPPHFWTL